MAPRLRGCPMVLLDLPGHGGATVVGRDQASPAAMGKAVVAALDVLGHDRVHLCGNSMGDRKGAGVGQDASKAHTLFERACKLGDRDACKEIAKNVN